MKLVIYYSCIYTDCLSYSFLGCPIDNLRCANGDCINKTLFCNGHRDCSDGSDEPSDCNHTCSQYLKVTTPYQLCDGVRNCLDKSDEAWSLCNKTACNQKGSYQCNRCVYLIS